MPQDQMQVLIISAVVLQWLKSPIVPSTAAVASGWWRRKSRHGQSPRPRRPITRSVHTSTFQTR